jgi:putative ABC transport system permease protein
MRGPLPLVRVMAWRRVADRPLRSCLTAAGVAAGVAFMLSILSLNAQLAANVRNSASLLTGPDLLQVTPASSGGLPGGLAGEVAATGQVAAAAPIVVARSTVSNGADEHGVFLVGLDANAAGLAPNAKELIESIARSTPAGTTGGVVLARAAADELGVGSGDEVTVHASTGARVLPVAAVVSSSVLDQVNGGMVAGMPLPAVQELLGRGDRVDQILVRAEPGTDMQALEDEIAVLTDGIGIVGSPGEATGEGSVDFAAVQSLTTLMGAFVVMAAVVLVFHTMSMATAERRTEIALARALGSSRKQLLLVTLTEAGFLGVVGTAVGLVVGAVLARLVVSLARYAYGGTAPVDIATDVSIQPGPAIVAAAVGLAGAIAGAVVPGRSAARATPIDAFRPTATYEWRDPTRSSRLLVRVAAGLALFVGGLAFAFRGTSGDLANPEVLLPVVAVYGGALILVPTAVPYVTNVVAKLLSRRSTTTGRLAADALRGNPRRTTINVMALLLPVTVVIMTALAFDSGFSAIGRLARAIVATPIAVDADSYVGGPGGAVASQPLSPSLQPTLEAVPGVRAALPYQNANVNLPDGSTGVVYAIPLAAAERAGVPDAVQIPRLADDPAAFTERLADGEIAASHFAARSLDLEPGSTITLPTPSGPHEFTVGELFDDWAFQGTFYVDLDTYRAVWGDESAYRYAVVPTPDANVDELRRELEAAVTAAGMSAEVRTRDEAVSELETHTTALLPLVRGITFASLVFAALALANAAFTAVNERRWTLALQRTFGMTDVEVSRSLGLESIVIGVVGSIGAAVVGIAMGLFTARVLANQLATTLPADIPWVLVAGSAVLGVAVAVGATYYPRRLARRLTIIESLRFD